LIASDKAPSLNWMASSAPSAKFRFFSAASSPLIYLLFTHFLTGSASEFGEGPLFYIPARSALRGLWSSVPGCLKDIRSESLTQTGATYFSLFPWYPFPTRGTRTMSLILFLRVKPFAPFPFAYVVALSKGDCRILAFILIRLFSYHPLPSVLELPPFNPACPRQRTPSFTGATSNLRSDDLGIRPPPCHSVIAGEVFPTIYTFPLLNRTSLIFPIELYQPLSAATSSHLSPHLT